MQVLFDFLLANPVLLGIPLILAVLIVVSIVKKLLKAALVLAIVLVIVGGAAWYFAGESMKKQGEELLNDVKQKVNKTLE